MGNNNCQFNCKKTETIKEEVNYTINETEEKKKNTMYTILNKHSNHDLFDFL